MVLEKGDPLLTAAFPAIRCSSATRSSTTIAATRGLSHSCASRRPSGSATGRRSEPAALPEHRRQWRITLQHRLHVREGFPPKRRVLMSVQMVLVLSPAKPVLSGLLHQGTCCFRLCKLVGRYRCARWCAAPNLPKIAHSRPAGRSRAHPCHRHPRHRRPGLPRQRVVWHARPHPGLLISEGTHLTASPLPRSPMPHVRRRAAPNPIQFRHTVVRSQGAPRDRRGM